MLPSGYTQLEYIQSSGTQYIDVGFKPGGNTRVVMDFQVLASHSGTAYPFGASGGGRYYEFCFFSQTNWGTTYSSGPMKTISVPGNTGDRLIVDKNKGVTTIKRGTQNYSTSVSNSSYQMTYNLFLFCYNRLGNAESFIQMTLFSTQIYDNGTLIRDFVPCKNSSGVIGLYDQVHSAFYANSGTGTFIAGPALAPDPPTNLTGTVLNQIVYLSWSASASSDVVGYNIYLDEVLIGTTTYLNYSYSITPGQNHIIAVTACGESAESNSISISVYYELPNPPTNLDATFDEGIVHLLWTDSTTEDVTGYRIYQNGVLVTTTPAVFSLFEFPFSNESLTENLLELSSLERVQFYQSIEPYTNYTFSVVAFNKYGESDPVSINVYYETTPDITSVSLIPNPVFTEESLTISVFVDTLYNVTIT